MAELQAYAEARNELNGIVAGGKDGAFTAADVARIYALAERMRRLQETIRGYRMRSPLMIVAKAE